MKDLLKATEMGLTLEQYQKYKQLKALRGKLISQIEMKEKEIEKLNRIIAEYE